jgi:hypothetical protein
MQNQAVQNVETDNVETTTNDDVASSTEKTEKKSKLTDAEKAERKSVREAKRAEKEAARPPKHSAKVATARNRLPKLDDGLTGTFDRLVGELTNVQLETLSSHLALTARERRTSAAISKTVKQGQVVRIVDGDAGYVGQVGTVVKANRIRCYVEVDGNPLYLFTSDVESVENDTVVADDSDIDVDAAVAVSA